MVHIVLFLYRSWFIFFMVYNLVISYYSWFSVTIVMMRGRLFEILTRYRPYHFGKHSKYRLDTFKSLEVLKSFMVNINSVKNVKCRIK